jgi:hypothetical protein
MFEVKTLNVCDRKEEIQVETAYVINCCECCHDTALCAHDLADAYKEADRLGFVQLETDEMLGVVCHTCLGQMKSEHDLLT